MGSDKGYTFLLSLVKDKTANETEREEALEALTYLGNENTLDELITLHEQPASIAFKKSIIRAIGKLTQHLQTLEGMQDGTKHEN